MTQTTTTITVDFLPTANSIDPVQDILPIYKASATDLEGISRNVYLGLSSQPVGISDSQTLSTKVLDNTNTITVKDANLVIQDDADVTKQAKFQLSGLSTGTTRTYTLPDVTDTLLTLTATQTITNKTFTSPTINSPTITNATLSSDSITGYSNATSGTIYGISVSSGIITTAGSVGSGANATNGVQAAALATNAIKLGKGTITSNITTSSTSNVQATGLTASVTIPAGGRSVKITAMLPSISNTTSGQAIAVNLWSGTVGSGTQLQEVVWFSTGNNVAIPVTLIAEHTPSSGAVTYNVGYRASANTATIAASSTAPAFILVEAI